MKILAISDVHGCFERLYKIIKMENPEIILFSGDGYEDVTDMQYAFPEIKFVCARGNCDYNSSFNDEEIIEIFDKKFFITHGHIYGVKRNYFQIEMRAKELDANVVVFGHTHSPYLKNKEQTIYFNPGAVLCGSYGVITINEDKNIKLIHKEVK